MTESRLKELQTEIAKLKQIDKETIERVVAEFFEIDIAELSCRTGDDTMGSFDENGDALEFILYIISLDNFYHILLFQL